MLFRRFHWKCIGLFSPGKNTPIYKGRRFRTCCVQVALFVLFALLSNSSALATNNADFISDVAVISNDWFRDSGYLHAEFVLKAPNETCRGDSERGTSRCYGDRSDATFQRCFPAVLTSTGKQASQANQNCQDFVYRARVRNNADRNIKAIQWDYVFLDPITNAELQRHTFYSEVKLRPGKTKLLVESSPTPPTRIIPLRLLFTDSSLTYIERVEIRSVIYADDSSVHWP